MPGVTVPDVGYTTVKKTDKKSEIELTFSGDLSSKDKYLNLNRNLLTKILQIEPSCAQWECLRYIWGKCYLYFHLGSQPHRPHSFQSVIKHSRNYVHICTTLPWVLLNKFLRILPSCKRRKEERKKKKERKKEKKKDGNVFWQCSTCCPLIHSLHWALESWSLWVTSPRQPFYWLLVELGQWVTKGRKSEGSRKERLGYFSPAHFLLGLCYSDSGSLHGVHLFKF